MRAAAAAAVAATLLAAGCGGRSGDLLAVDSAGGPPGVPKRTVVITEDGRAGCDGGELRRIEGDLLIDAREIERESTELTDRAASFEGGGPPNARRYALRSKSGTVRWTEGRRGLPPVLPRAALLALRVGREVCGR